MAIDVVAAEPDGVTLGAPLEPNINHRDTVFGGSAAAVAILSAWGLLFVRLRDEYPNATIVIQRHTMRHLRPITGAFTASSFLADPGAWDRFVTTYRRRKTGPHLREGLPALREANRSASSTPPSSPSS